jgi:hypothetical protein
MRKRLSYSGAVPYREPRFSAAVAIGPRVPSVSFRRPLRKPLGSAECPPSAPLVASSPEALRPCAPQERVDFMLSMPTTTPASGRRRAPLGSHVGHRLAAAQAAVRAGVARRRFSADQVWRKLALVDARDMSTRWQGSRPSEAVLRLQEACCQGRGPSVGAIATTPMLGPCQALSQARAGKPERRLAFAPAP